MRKKRATAEAPAPAPSVKGDETTGTAAPHNGQAVSADEVRLRAYQKWEAVGRPGGDGVAFWVEAERELQQAR